MNMQAGSVVPLYIGVSGHRDIPLDSDSLAGFRTSIQGILEFYRKDCPHTEIRLMSLLASGADSVAAETALDMGIKVTGILPLPKDEYTKDFGTEHELATFNRLCGLCSELYELPLRDYTVEDIRPNGPARDQRYAAGGEFLAHHSHALIAIWNGCDNGLTGGTAHVARMQLEGISLEQSLDTPTSGPVHWIYSARTRHDEQLKSSTPMIPEIPCIQVVSAEKGDLESSCTATLYPAEWRAGTTGTKDEEAMKKAGKFYMSLRKSIDRFNLDVLGNQRPLDSLSKDFTEDPSFLEPIARLFASADACSIKYQRKADSMMIRLGLGGLAAFGSMVVFDELLNYTYTLIVFFLLLVATYAIHQYGVRKEYDGRYFDYRSLAELCRVTYYLGLSGIEFDPGALIPGRYRSSLSWIAYAGRSVAIPMELAAVHIGDTKSALTRWVSTQYEWYIKKLPEKQKTLDRRRVLRLGFFVFAIVIASGFFAGKIYGMLSGTDVSPWWDLRLFKSGQAASWIQTLFDICISVGAVFAFFMEIKAYEDEIELYRRASSAFKRALEKLKHSKNQDSMRLVLYELGSMAINENAEWNAVHRARPLELPMG